MSIATQKTLNMLVRDRFIAGNPLIERDYNLISSKKHFQYSPTITTELHQDELIEIVQFDCVRMELGTLNVGKLLVSFYFDVTWIQDRLYILLCIRSHEPSGRSYSHQPRLTRSCCHTKIVVALQLANHTEVLTKINQIIPLSEDDLSSWLGLEKEIGDHLFGHFEDLCSSLNRTELSQQSQIRYEPAEFDQYVGETPFKPAGLREYMEKWQKRFSPSGRHSNSSQQ